MGGEVIFMPPPLPLFLFGRRIANEIHMGHENDSSDERLPGSARGGFALANMHARRTLNLRCELDLRRTIICSVVHVLDLAARQAVDILMVLNALTDKCR
jgi:hypothetical protein